MRRCCSSTRPNPSEFAAPPQARHQASLSSSPTTSCLQSATGTRPTMKSSSRFSYQKPIPHNQTPVISIRRRPRERLPPRRMACDFGESGDRIWEYSNEWGNVW
ncbi:hypothetical protein Salat_2302300 [Sesamum alatum]|uniref:Uncharacterized protein n=1 Tax=Sesamum alatum TaxID=300844 RepID=A0AAE2CEA2_9LAMI|nr:hypothetical protein Salat_2302300 [Sesamum alatum]